MKTNKELYQEMLEKKIEIEAKKQGLTVEDLLIMLDEQKAEERKAYEQELENKYWDRQAEINNYQF